MESSIRLTRLMVVVLASILVGLVAIGINRPVFAISSQLEQQVLQVIREHPDVIIESVQAYQQEQQAQVQQAQQAFAQQMQAQPAAVIGDSPTTGAVDNPVVLLEFSDFQCPFCADANQTVKQFVDQHGDEVMWVYKALPLTGIHSQALGAAQAAWAAQQQGQFWAYADALYTQQDDLGDAVYQQIAKNLNLDLEQFDRDRHSPAATAAINADVELAQQIGINGTPFFMFNGEVLKSVTLPDMERLLAQVH